MVDLTQRRSGWLLTAAVLLAGVASAGAAEDERAAGFVELGVDEAIAAAREQGKQPLVVFHAPSNVASAELVKTLWGDERCALLLSARTVPICVTLPAEAEVARRYGVRRAPTLLLLDKEGRESDCIFPYASPREMLAELYDALAGTDAVTRMRERIVRASAGGAPNPFLQERLAMALRRQHRYDEALAAYLVCVDTGLQSVRFGVYRREPLAEALAELVEAYPAAKPEIQRRRNAWELLLLEGAEQVNVARDLAALHAAFGESQRTLVVFDALPPGSRCRRVLHPLVLGALVAEGRYTEALEGIDAVELFRTRVEKTPAGGSVFYVLPEPGKAPDLGTATELGVTLLAALAATDRTAEALKLLHALRGVDESAAARRKLHGLLAEVETRTAQQLRGLWPEPAAQDPNAVTR